VLCCAVLCCAVQDLGTNDLPRAIGAAYVTVQTIILTCQDRLRTAIGTE
jgi:hypothetical protein